MVTSNRGSQPDSQSTAGQTPRYATFNSTKVLICGYPDDIISALSKYVEQEGGKVLRKYYKGSRPDVIVCGTVADRNVKVRVRQLLLLSNCCAGACAAFLVEHEAQHQPGSISCPSSFLRYAQHMHWLLLVPAGGKESVAG